MCVLIRSYWQKGLAAITRRGIWQNLPALLRAEYRTGKLVGLRSASVKLARKRSCFDNAKSSIGERSQAELWRISFAISPVGMADCDLGPRCPRRAGRFVLQPQTRIKLGGVGHILTLQLSAYVTFGRQYAARWGDTLMRLYARVIEQSEQDRHLKPVPASNAAEHGLSSLRGDERKSSHNWISHHEIRLPQCD